jgi:hypothetical protein
VSEIRNWEDAYAVLEEANKRITDIAIFLQAACNKKELSSYEAYQLGAARSSIGYVRASIDSLGSAIGGMPREE